MTDSLDKSFEGSTKTSRADRSVDQGQNNSSVSLMFGGTQEKCVTCKKTVYPLEKVAVDGNASHRACFKCSHGGCVISPSNFVAHEYQIYCRHHHSQLFKAKGKFSQLVKLHRVTEIVKNDQVEVVNNDQVKEVISNGQVIEIVRNNQVEEVTENTTA